MPRLRSLERARAELDGRIGQFRGEIARARQAIGETRLQMIDLDNQRAAEVVGELRDVQRAIADLREQVRAAEDVLSRRDIVAPVDGSIVNLATVTPGGVVGPGAALMEIVPEDDRLTVSARLRPTDIDSVHAGLPAEVRLTAFKAWSTPTLHGEVTYVSADVLADENTGEPYYDLRVEVDRAEVERLRDVSLYPGMPVRPRSSSASGPSSSTSSNPFSTAARGPSASNDGLGLAIAGALFHAWSVLLDSGRFLPLGPGAQRCRIHFADLSVDIFASGRSRRNPLRPPRLRAPRPTNRREAVPRCRRFGTRGGVHLRRRGSAYELKRGVRR